MSRINQDLVREVLNLLIGFSYKPDEKLASLMEQVRIQAKSIVLLRNIDNDHPLIKGNLDKISRVPVSVHEFNKKLYKLKHMLKNYTCDCNHNTNISNITDFNFLSDLISSLQSIYVTN